MTTRTEQLSSLVQQNLNEIFVKDFEFPKDSLATITKVEVTADLSWAFVYLSILPINKQGTVLKKLKNNASFLQHQLNKTLHLRKFPKLQFKIDDSELHSRKIERKLEENN